MESKQLSGGAMKALVEADKLKRVDILLTRSKGNLLGWLIRFGTKSYWNHAAMVYVIRNPQEGYNETYIIESGGAGIDIHNISHYFNRPDKCDVGIKRLDKDWFQSGTVDFPRKVRGLALQEIDDKYNYRLILGIAQKVVRQLVIAFVFPFLRFKSSDKRRSRRPRLAKLFKVNTYICSGFVQWSYFTTVTQQLEKSGGNQGVLQDVIFNPEIRKDVDEELLLSTTPADIANSDCLSWKYIIKNGKVWEIANDADVKAILAH